MAERAENPLSASALMALERFVVDNDDLLALESRIGRFNIFDALNIARVEIRHSNFLAFILDPAESHGQSQLFLKAALMDLLKSAPPHRRPFSPVELDGIDLQGVEVRREWNHIDLLITCQHPPFVVAVENKVYSGEHSNQLSRYRETIRQHYPEAPSLYVFLTPDAAEPSEDEWVPYSYADLHRVLSRVRRTHGSAIGDDVLVFLDHYLTLIGTRFMDDAKIDELCQRIYKNHRQALQLIFERAGTPGGGVISDVEAVIRDDPRWHVVYRAGRYVDSVPTSWLEWLPPLTHDYEDGRAWIVFRFRLYEGRLDFYVQVNRMKDLGRRRKIVEKLLVEGPKFGVKRKHEREITDSYTRVSSREKVIGWSEDERPDSSAIRVAVKGRLDAAYASLNGLAEVLRIALQ